MLKPIINHADRTIGTLVKLNTIGTIHVTLGRYFTPAMKSVIGRDDLLIVGKVFATHSVMGRMLETAPEYPLSNLPPVRSPRSPGLHP